MNRKAAISWENMIPPREFLKRLFLSPTILKPALSNAKLGLRLKRMIRYMPFYVLLIWVRMNYSVQKISNIRTANIGMCCCLISQISIYSLCNQILRVSDQTSMKRADATLQSLNRQLRRGPLY